MPSDSFEDTYPNLAQWAKEGWVELGPTDWTDSFIRLMDPGGALWEGKKEYSTFADAFADAERFIIDWHR